MKFDIQEEQLIIKPYKSSEPIYVRKIKGFYQTLRRKINWIAMALFIFIPFIQYNGQQAVLLDVGNQQFRVFGITFFPHDFMILTWLFMASAFALFFVTVWLGRVWCGYTCPQTIWMMMFLWVEDKIEGNRNKRIKLDKSGMSINKFSKKLSKHAVWVLLSFLTATTFMSYFIPVTTLYSDLVSWEWSSVIAGWVFFFTLCTYGNAGFLREKMCIYMCPYARFQSAMFDKDTLLVAYDKERGENRGKRKRKDNPAALNLGDCVDCNLCVEVCPTGIDIRNGLQYECINCASCIDACDQTMDKFGYAKGLISYTSENKLAGKKVHPVRMKIVAYAVITALLFVAMGIWLHLRIPMEASIIRDRQSLYRVNFDGKVENSYILKLTNKSQQITDYELSIDGLKDIQISLPEKIEVAAGSWVQIPITITKDPYDLNKTITHFNFEIRAKTDDAATLRRESMFYRP